MRKKVVSMMLGIIMLLNIMITPVSAMENGLQNTGETDPGYTIDYQATDGWGNTQLVTIKITNTGTSDLEGWAIKFEAEGTITGLWDASVYMHEGTTYILEAPSYNLVLKPNQTATIGYQYTSDNKDKPKNLTLCTDQAEMDGGYAVELKKISSWSNIYSCQIVINNMTENPIKAWDLTFDSNFEINQITNAQIISSENKTHNIKGADNTNIIPANSSVTMSVDCIALENPKISNAKLSKIVYRDRDESGGSGEEELSINIAIVENVQKPFNICQSGYTNSLSNNSAIVGKVFDIYHDNKSELDSVKLNFIIPKAIINNTENRTGITELRGLRRFQVFHYNEEYNVLYPVQTTYDKGPNIISTKSKGLGTYCVIDMDKWISDLGLLKEVFTGDAVLWKNNGHYYKVFDDSMIWEGADAKCKQMGGHLVTITSKDEQKFIEDNLLTPAYANQNLYWIGLSREKGDEHWRWTNGELFIEKNANWDEGEPNNSLENYVHMYNKSPKGTSKHGKWNDTKNENNDEYSFYATKNCGYICEWDSDPNIIFANSVSINKLNVPLVKDGKTDTDTDGLTDSQEVDWTFITPEYGAELNYNGTVIKLPTYKVYLDAIKASTKLEERETFDKFKNLNIDLKGLIEGMEVLPIKSDPTRPDSDGDGIADGNLSQPLPGTFKPDEYWNTKYVTEFPDPNPFKFEILWQWPVIDLNGKKVYTLSSCFTDGRNHGAIDIVAPNSYDVISSSYGEVIEIGLGCTHNYKKYYTNDKGDYINGCDCNGGCGNYIKIKSSFNGKDYIVRYIHLSRVLVQKGDTILPNQKIGEVGSTGNSQGFHLDFQIKEINGEPIDPILFNEKNSMLMNIPKSINFNAASGDSRINHCNQYLKAIIVMYKLQ